jgi:hypothetical protein
MLYESDYNLNKPRPSALTNSTSYLQQQAQAAAKKAAEQAAATKAAATAKLIAQQQQVATALKAAGVKDLAGTPIAAPAKVTAPVAPKPVTTTVAKPVVSSPVSSSPVVSTPIQSSTPVQTGGGGGSVSVNTDGNPSAPYETSSSEHMPSMQSGASMGRHLGVVYDRNEFLRQMRGALEAKYSNLGIEYDRIRDGYHDDVGIAADQTMAQLRRGDQNATMSGVTAGSNTAQQLMALKGISQDAAKGATEIAQGQADLVYKKEADLADSEFKATQAYNELGLGLGALSRQELDSRVQGYGMQLASKSAEEVAQIAALAQKYQTDGQANATRYAANQSLAGMQAQAAATAASASAYGQNNQQTKQMDVSEMVWLMENGHMSSDDFYAMMAKQFGMSKPQADAAKKATTGLAPPESDIPPFKVNTPMNIWTPQRDK